MTAVIAAPCEAQDLSVVICTYTEERWADLLKAIESVRAQTMPAREIVIAVDHNRALAERARSELCGVQVIENHGTRGLSGARNAGFGAARGAIVAFLDDDAVADPDWLERLAEPYADPAVLGVGGTIDADWIEGRPRAFPGEFDWVVGCTYTGHPAVPTQVRNLIGANMSLRRSVLDLIGGFANGVGRVGQMTVGCENEETELFIRASQTIPGGTFVFEPAARVAHTVPPSRAHWRYFTRRCFSEGISKARLARTAGNDAALSTERSYVARALPAGVARGVRDALRGDHFGLGRAALIVMGLAFTTAGYLIGSLRRGPR